MIDLLTQLWQPAHFYVGNGLRCAWQFEAEQALPWEIFRGQLVSPTRERKTFLTWNLIPVVDGVLGEPLLSLLLDDDQVHVTRSIHVRVWRPLDGEGGIVTEEATAWSRELVGSVPKDAPELAAEVQTLIRLAIVGTSRLPLTSLESPMPQFTFGQLMYAPRPLNGVDPRLPRREARDLPVAGDSRILETILRAADEPEADQGAPRILESNLRAMNDPLLPLLAGENVPSLLKRMFNEVSLTPYTHFVPRAFSLMAELPQEPELLSWLTRRITRHLTAYDLVLFHYRGANYPDALVLDFLVTRLVARSEAGVADPLFRRALRMGCLVRAVYEGHRVPAHPTSPGEGMRVLPAPFGQEPAAERELYEVSLSECLPPHARAVLRAAMLDLERDEELREGGIGLFIDRPLGFFKAPAEVDRTPLVSYVCFSRRLATRRLIECEQLSSKLDLGVPAHFWEQRRRQLAGMSVTGLSLDHVPDSPRPAVSLADARKVSDDFVVLRTTPGSLRDFWSAIGVTSGDWPLVARIVHEKSSMMAAFDAAMRPVWLFDGDWSQGSLVRRGIETPRGGVHPAYNAG